VTAPPAAARPRWRALDGIVLLDKPAGLGSTPALQRVRRLLRAEKAGHAGTLDPMATGMLPLCFGQATKACGALLGSGKSYRARLRLGARTDTGDADGQVVGTGPLPQLDGDRVATALAGLAGAREQRPPMYSALKHGGRPLYELARRGEVVERATRPVVIRRLEALAWRHDELEFEVHCSKGTYVRVLGEEIAAALGTVGHLVALRRLQVEPFDPASMVSLDDIERWAADAAAPACPPWLLPADAAFDGLPRLDLDPARARALRQGRTVPAPGRPEPGPLRAYGADGTFLGLVEPALHEQVRVLRLFVPGEGGSAVA
jgi:tRNA pseudouridine55 synthase